MALGFSAGRYILNGKLDFLRSRISLQKRYQHKGPIQSGRHASSADDTVQASVTSPVLPMRTPAAPHSRAPVQPKTRSAPRSTIIQLAACTVGLQPLWPSTLKQRMRHLGHKAAGPFDPGLYYLKNARRPRSKDGSHSPTGGPSGTIDMPPPMQFTANPSDRSIQEPGVLNTNRHANPGLSTATSLACFAEFRQAREQLLTKFEPSLPRPRCGVWC